MNNLFLSWTDEDKIGRSITKSYFMEFYKNSIIFDVNGQAIHQKFIIFQCGHIVQNETSKYYYDRIHKKYHAKCVSCDKPMWIDSFGCLGCLESSLTPMHCQHKRENIKCKGMTQANQKCPYKIKINNGGYCARHNNEKGRVKKVDELLESLLFLPTDLKKMILKYI